jgi:hypothetical protein
MAVGGEHGCGCRPQSSAATIAARPSPAVPHMASVLRIASACPEKVGLHHGLWGDERPLQPRDAQRPHRLLVL